MVSVQRGSQGATSGQPFVWLHRGRACPLSAASCGCACPVAWQGMFTCLRRGQWMAIPASTIARQHMLCMCERGSVRERQGQRAGLHGPSRQIWLAKSPVGRGTCAANLSRSLSARALLSRRRRSNGSLPSMPSKKRRVIPSGAKADSRGIPKAPRV